MKLDLTQKVLTRPVVANFEKFLYAIKIYVWITSDWLKKNSDIIMKTYALSLVSHDFVFVGTTSSYFQKLKKSIGNIGIFRTLYT